jgi:hypothetical protein
MLFMLDISFHIFCYFSMCLICFACVQGLVPSLMELCPNAEHRICVWHLYANFRNDGHRGVLLKDMLWRVVASYT